MPLPVASHPLTAKHGNRARRRRRQLHTAVRVARLGYMSPIGLLFEAAGSQKLDSGNYHRLNVL